MGKRKKQIKYNSVKGASSSSGSSSLGRMDYVRQVTLDRYPVTVRSRKPMKIGAWAIQTMLQKGKLDNLKQEIERMNLNILGLSEVRWKGAGHITSDNYSFLYSGGDQHQRGVGMILDQNISKAIKGVLTVNDRVLIVKLKATPFDIGIVQVFAPTADKDDAEKGRILRKY